jgi:hypothetical protein
MWPGGPWLTTDDYKAWARIDPADTSDDVAIGEAVAATMEAVELRAPRAFQVDDSDPPEPLPVPGMAVQAGLLMVNRLMSRRNSPDGVVGVPDLGAAVVLSYDADVSQMLGPWTEMVVA